MTRGWSLFLRTPELQKGAGKCNIWDLKEVSREQKGRRRSLGPEASCRTWHLSRALWIPKGVFHIDHGGGVLRAEGTAHAKSRGRRMLVGRGQEAGACGSGGSLWARSSTEEAEELAPWFLVFFLGSSPRAAASVLRDKCLRGAALRVCRASVGHRVSVGGQSLTSVFGLGKPVAMTLCCLPSCSSSFDNSEAFTGEMKREKMWSLGSPH